jgi:integrase/recombinase XerD
MLIAAPPPMIAIPFPSLIQRYFAEHLITHRNVSPQTIAAYRDTFRLLLRFLCDYHHRPVDQLTFAALEPDAVLAFLHHLEAVRHNATRTRNARWAALRSFVHFVLALTGPEHLAQGQRLLAIPFKRCVQPIIGFMTRDEVAAVLAACDHTTWSNRRDRVLFTLMYNTGARVSEIIQLRVGDADGQVVRLHGKGRKERQVPLWPETRRLIQQWIRTHQLRPDQPLFAYRQGMPLTRVGVQFRLARAVRVAARDCPSLATRRISPHTFRHATALHLLQAGVALEVISLWLGHASPSTTYNYLEADLKMKADVIAKIDSPPLPPRHRRTQYSRVLSFLEAL